MNSFAGAIALDLSYLSTRFVVLASFVQGKGLVSTDQHG